jgi:hypothetical protein
MANQLDHAFKAHCRLEVDKPFTGVVPGRILHQEDTATGSVLETSVDVPVGKLGFTVGPYEEQVFRDPRTKVALHVHGYAAAPSKAKTQRLANAIQGVIGYYQTFLGPFPFEDLHVVPTGSGPQATGLPGMLTFPPKVGGYYVSNEGVARALAEQYWGVAVRGRSLDAGPVARSFEGVCAMAALRAMRGVGEREASRLFNGWKTSSKFAKDVSSISHAEWLVYPNRDYRESGFPFTLQGPKFSVVLEKIHTDVGDATFTAFLTALQREFAWKPMDAVDLPLVLGRVTGKDWMPFFQKYYWGTAPVDWM